MKKYNFIHKLKIIEVYAETFEQAQVLAQEIMDELDQLEMNE